MAALGVRIEAAASITGVVNNIGKEGLLEELLYKIGFGSRLQSNASGIA